jgi:hypothetical protein
MAELAVVVTEPQILPDHLHLRELQIQVAVVVVALIQLRMLISQAKMADRVLLLFDMSPLHHRQTQPAAQKLL